MNKNKRGDDNKLYYFIRVGSDSNEDVPFSMIIDNKLLFIPITETDPENNGKIDEYSFDEISKFKYYSNLIRYFGRVDKTDFLNFHLDPFFDFNNSGEMSYCDRTINENGKRITKAIALDNLRPSKRKKYLFFLATVVTPTENELKNFKDLSWDEVRARQKNMKKKLALIGFMKVDNIHLLSSLNFSSKKSEICRIFKSNPHVKRIETEKEELDKDKNKKLIFVRGNLDKSLFLFENPLILGESKNKHYELYSENKKFFNNKLNSFGYRAYKFFNNST
ncbi:hypothetical protein COY26_03320, partial [Candidatus Woesearchaeota archaeon CG_4_10_14_0_2_um_filter_33_10]